MAGRERPDMTKGQKAIALAMHYPEAEKTAPGRHAKSTTLLETKSVSASRQARAILRFSPDIALAPRPWTTSSGLRTARRRPAVAAHERGLRAAWFLICKRYRPVRASLACGTAMIVAIAFTVLTLFALVIMAAI
jgi:hypothetical protein